MKETTEKQLTDRLVKGGCNLENASKLAKKHLEFLNRVYPDETLKTKCDIAMTLGLN